MSGNSRRTRPALTGILFALLAMAGFVVNARVASAADAPSRIVGITATLNQTPTVSGQAIILIVFNNSVTGESNSADRILVTNEATGLTSEVSGSNATLAPGKYSLEAWEFRSLGGRPSINKATFPVVVENPRSNLAP